LRLQAFIPVLLFFSLCSKNHVPVDYLARVNDTYLTKDDLLKILPDPDNTKFADKDYIKSIISSWIENEIIYQRAKKYHFDRDESILYKVKKYEKELIIDSYIRYLMQSNVTVTENEIRDYYFKNRSSFTREFDEATVSHVVVNDFDEANRIKSVLESKKRSELDRLFQKHNFETKTISHGGAIKEIDRTIFETTPRRILGPIPTDYGYHIIEVLSRYRAGSVRSIDEVRDEILQQITQSKIQERYTALIDSLISSTDIEIRDENISNWDRANL
jgi:parvulin-like peptidyl-prolyl isomerase